MTINMGSRKEDEKVDFKPPQDETYLKWGLIYPRNPKLQYLYPSPNVTILTNIANTLAAYPKFYVQVLHLMNKMNLPAPFGAPTPTPPVPSGEPEVSSSESELESDSEEQKSQAKQKKKNKRQREVRKESVVVPMKRIKLIEDFPTMPSFPVETSEVFDLNVQSTQKQIHLKIPSAIDTKNTLDKPRTSTPDEESNPPTQGGFGMIEPLPKASEEKEQEEETDFSEFISEQELLNGRLSEKEQKGVNVFKKYNKGDPSSRLYIKNLAKQTDEKDLKYIFGRYINWASDFESNAFDVRVMKEGRMKGQAFVTLPSEEAAVKALTETHAFMLNEKPMLVQFARSAKASADPNTEDK